MAGSFIARQSKTILHHLKIAVAVFGTFRESLRMQVKIFNGSDRAGLEKQINEWLHSISITKIHYVTHANDGNAMCITVWWM
jgi:hypothetical protein